MHSSEEYVIISHSLSIFIYSSYILSFNLCLLFYISALTVCRYPLYDYIHPVPPIASAHLALFYLPFLPSFYLLSLIPSHPQANFPTVPFPTSSFLSISPLIYLSCWAPYTVWCPPSMFMLYVCYLYPLPGVVKLIALCKALLAPPKPLTMLAVTGARLLKITLHWASSLSAGLFPADVANAAYYHCAPMPSFHVSFSTPFYSFT